MNASTTAVASAFATAVYCLTETIAALRGIGQNADNGPFGSVMMDLDRILAVCKGREEAARKGDEVAAPAPVEVVAVAAPAPVEKLAPVKVKKAPARKVKVAAEEVAAPAAKVEVVAPAAKVEVVAPALPASYKEVVALKADGMAALAKTLGVKVDTLTFMGGCKEVWAAVKGNAKPSAKVKAAKVKEVAAKPADPIVPGCFDANGKPMTLAAVMAALDTVAKGK